MDAGLAAVVAVGGTATLVGYGWLAGKVSSGAVDAREAWGYLYNYRGVFAVWGTAVAIGVLATLLWAGTTPSVASEATAAAAVMLTGAAAWAPMVVREAPRAEAAAVAVTAAGAVWLAVIAANAAPPAVFVGAIASAAHHVIIDGAWAAEQVVSHSSQKPI